MFSAKLDKNYLHDVKKEEIIYRIFSLERFCEMFKSKQLSLVTPEMWDDPFENFYLKANGISSEGPVSLEELRKGWFGQCWTKHEDTDAMWRIYSPNKNGVRLKTTVSKIFKAVSEFQGNTASYSSFIGDVKYKSRKELIQMHGESFFANIVGGNNLELAKKLLVKREAFEHEAEVRVLAFVSTNNLKNYPNGIYQVPIEPENLFEEICLDPRLDNAQNQSISAMIQSITNIPVVQSDLYHFNLPPINIDS